MSGALAHKILLADEDPGVRHTLAMVLTSAGYDVSTAEHGIDAVFLLQGMVPDVVVYALDTPQVPGYDLLAVIRSRMPQVSVIAMVYPPAEDGPVPDGVYADALYIKGQSGPQALLDKVAQLIQTGKTRAVEHMKNGGQALAANQKTRRASAKALPSLLRNLLR